MIDTVMFWNEPNSKSHWDFEINQERVPGGISPIDPNFIGVHQAEGSADYRHFYMGLLRENGSHKLAVCLQQHTPHKEYDCN